MPAPFRRFSIREFETAISGFEWNRRVWRIDMHHTRSPAHADYDGLATIERMALRHTRDCGCGDIAQHISVAPDGAIWTGRDWNHDPASVGCNMNAGVFMLDVIGNFDHGGDRLAGRQLESVIGVIGAVQRQFRLPIQALLFHREVPQTAKSCPGNSIDKAEILRLLAAHRSHGAPVDHGQTALVA